MTNNFQEFQTMLKRKLTQPDIYLIVANLLPVYGVWALGWNAIEVFIVYAMETLIVGMLTVLKFGIASVSGNNSNDWYVGDKKGETTRYFIHTFLYNPLRNIRCRANFDIC